MQVTIQYANALPDSHELATASTYEFSLLKKKIYWPKQ